MPNWCSNSLSITGKDEDMKEILDLITVEDSFQILNKLYPTPEELEIGNVPMVPNEQMEKNKEKYGYNSWYDWRIDKWGCKWPESYLHLSQSYTVNSKNIGTIAFEFETPWGPPTNAFDYIAEKYPKILFCLYYEEPGMGFCGKSIWADGEQQESYGSELIRNEFDEDYYYDIYINNNITANN